MPSKLSYIVWQRVRFYLLAVALVAAAHLLIARTSELLGPATYTVFMGAVVVAAFLGGYGPSLLATVLATVDLLYTFLPPYHSFRTDFEDFVFLLAFLVVALLTSTLQARQKRAEESLRQAHDDLEARVRDRTAELARSRAQLSVLVNGVADQAFLTLDAFGAVASWNAGAERLLGYDVSDVVGRPVSHILPGVTLPLARSTATEEQDWALRKDGGRIWTTLVLTPMSATEAGPGGYAVALRDITERRSLERDILEISEREQLRIGRDLHDGLGQELTGIAMLSTALAERVTGETVAADAEQVAELVHETIRHTRELARGLCPVNLEDDGLADALALLCGRIDRLPDIRCDFDHDAAGDDRAAGLGEAIATHLYRIAQEATTNAIRHGRARRITVRLALNGQSLSQTSSQSSSQSPPQSLSLSVRDDGVGFAPGVGFGPGDSQGGMGLRLMHYRAKMCQGSLTVSPAPGGGTVVECLMQSIGVPQS